MSLLRLLMRSSRLLVFLAIGCGLLASASSTGIMALIIRALSATGRPPVTLALGFAGLLGLMMLTRLASELLLNHLYHGVLYELRLGLSRRILAAPLRTLEEHGTHRLLAALADDILVISNGLMMLPPMLISALLLVGCLVYMGWLSPALFLSLAAFLAFGLLSYWLIARRALGMIRIGRETQDTLFKHFRGLTEGTKELKLNRGRRNVFVEALGTTASLLRETNRHSSHFYALASVWGSSLFFVFIGLLLFVLPNLLRLEGSTVMGYTLTVLFLQQPLGFLMSYLPITARASVALQKLEDLGLSLPERESLEDASGASGALERPVEHHVLECVGLQHSYHREQEDASFVLGPLDLHLSSGEVVFLVGGNGSGKTTLAKLLTGLYGAEGGSLKLDGVTLTDANREWYRQHFSAVFSDFYLFESLLGLAPADRLPSVQSYLKKLHLDRKVTVKEGTLSTVSLSQGQRKRLALLAAYLEDRPFYVFDEWAADQDPLFKGIFYEQLLPELKQRGKAVLVISHDDRYFGMASRVLRLEAGRWAASEHEGLSSPPPQASPETMGSAAEGGGTRGDNFPLAAPDGTQENRSRSGRRTMRFVQYAVRGVGALALVAGVAIGILALAFPRSRAASTEKVEITPARIARGQYLFHHVTACVSCHAERDFKQYAAPVKEGTIGAGMCFPPELRLPGEICSGNLTPHPQAGIGAWTDGELMRAIREGIGRDGRALFSMMPYAFYRHLSDEDTRSLVAYMRSLAPLDKAVPRSRFGTLVSLVVRLSPRPLTGEPVQAPAPSDRIAYGRYLAEVAACGDCHSPKGIPFAGGARYRGTGGVEVSSNLTPDPETGLGRVSREAFIGRFKAFENLSPSPQLGRVVMPWQAFSGMSEEDLGAIYDYLGTVAPVVHDVSQPPK